MIKIGIAAAAALLIGVALLLNTPSAKAVTIEQIYKAIEKARNVYVASFAPDQKEPTQEKWMSRSLNIYITKTGTLLVLWDFSNKVRKTKHMDNGTVETTVLSAEITSDIKTTTNNFLGLVPFASLSVVPKDTNCSRVTDPSLGTVTNDIEVYDLTWVSKTYSGSTEYRRWRVFVDFKTNLPQRTESYRKSAGDIEYILVSVKTVKYLSDGEMQEVIKEASF